MPLILEPWEKVRASELERRVREFALEGTTGAETTPAPLAGVMTPEQYDAQGIGPGARSAAYTTFPPLAIQPPWWWASPVPTGTLDLGVAPMQIPGGFANGWGDYAGAFPAAARANILGELELRGIIAHANPTETSTIFVLPAPLRPTRAVHFPVAAGAGLAIVKVYETGAVDLMSYHGGSAVWVDLSAVRVSRL